MTTSRKDKPATTMLAVSNDIDLNELAEYYYTMWDNITD